MDEGRAVLEVKPVPVPAGELPPIGRTDDAAVPMVPVAAVPEVAKVAASEQPTETVTVETAHEAAQAVIVTVVV